MFIVDVALDVVFTQMLDKSGSSYYLNIKHVHWQSQKQVASFLLYLIVCKRSYVKSYHKSFCIPIYSLSVISINEKNLKIKFKTEF